MTGALSAIPLDMSRRWEDACKASVRVANVADRNAHTQFTLAQLLSPRGMI